MQSRHSLLNIQLLAHSSAIRSVEEVQRFSLRDVLSCLPQVLKAFRVYIRWSFLLEVSIIFGKMNKTAVPNTTTPAAPHPPPPHLLVPEELSQAWTSHPFWLLNKLQRFVMYTAYENRDFRPDWLFSKLMWTAEAASVLSPSRKSPTLTTNITLHLTWSIIVNKCRCFVFCFFLEIEWLFQGSPGRDFKTYTEFSFFANTKRIASLCILICESWQRPLFCVL